MRTYACDYLLPHSFTQNMEPARLSHRYKDRSGGKLIVAMDGQNYSSIYEELFKPRFPEGKKSSRRGFDIHSYEQNSASSINSIKNKVLVTLILIKLKESTIV